MNNDTLVILLFILILNLFSVGFLSMLFLFFKKNNDTESDESKQLSDIWKTSDGKYVASSLEELITIMAADPDGPLSEDEIEAFWSIFRKISGDDNSGNDSNNKKW